MTTSNAIVELSWSELRRAAQVGIDRFVRALSQHRPPRYGEEGDAWPGHVVGAWGECVIAKVTGIYWVGDLGRPDDGQPDVGPYHVRTTLRSNGCLILHDGDADAEPFVLVVPVALPRFRIVGWCSGAEGKRPEHWRRDVPHPAWFVPQQALRPLDELTP